MKRLVTQFDDTRTRATVATPTCSSCCCCCCCIASILTASSVTVMNIGDVASQSNQSSGKTTGLKVLGFFVFPLAIAIGIASAFIISIGGIAVLIVAWMLLLKLIYRKAGSSEPSKVIGATVGLGTAFFVAEFIGGGAMILSGFGLNSPNGGGGEGAALYLILAVVLPFATVPLLRRITRPLLKPDMIFAADGGGIQSPPTVISQAFPTQDQPPAVPANSQQPVTASPELPSESDETITNQQSGSSEIDKTQP